MAGRDNSCSCTVTADVGVSLLGVGERVAGFGGKVVRKVVAVVCACLLAPLSASKLLPKSSGGIPKGKIQQKTKWKTGIEVKGKEIQRAKKPENKRKTDNNNYKFRRFKGIPVPV